jgi:hypothetical protein
MAERPSDYRIEDHLCAGCLGRVVSRKGKGEARIFRCSNCGASGVGSVRSICACGSRIANKDAGIRCVVNDRRTPDLMSEIVAKEIT